MRSLLGSMRSGVNLNDFIRQRIAKQPRRLASQALVAAACVLAATTLRLALTPSIGVGLPYITYFPAVMIAGIVGGFRAGLVTLLGSTLAAFWLFIAKDGPPVGSTSDWIGVATFL